MGRPLKGRESQKTCPSDGWKGPVKAFFSVRKDDMHLYWRIIEELKFLGETWMINDPNLLRCFRLWLEKKADVIALSLEECPPKSSPLFNDKDIKHSLN